MPFPTITGGASRTAEVTASEPLAAGPKPVSVRAAFGVALHMHQPTVLGAGDRTSAPLISNLQHMLEHPGEGDNHNAPVVPALLRARRRSRRRAGRARAAARG